MGIKVIQLSDEEVSVILTGLTLAHNKYYTNKDEQNMLLSDRLIDLLQEVEVFISERSSENEKKQKQKII